MLSDDEMLGIAGGKYPASRKKKKRSDSLGALHVLLKSGLPDFVDNGCLDVKALGKALGVSYQAIYKWFERDSINPGRVDEIVNLSLKTERKFYDFRPLSRDDFWPYMGR